MKRLIAAVALACLAGAGLAWLVPSMSEGAGAKPASVKLKLENIVAEIAFERGPKLTLTSKPSPLAEGTYTVKTLSVFQKDDKGKVWELRAIPEQLGSLATITVDAEQEKIVDVGPPLSFHGWSRQGDPPKQDIVHLGFTAIGRMTVRYVPSVFLGGRRGPGPTLRLLTPEGKLIHQAAFSVAKDGQCTYEWKPGAFRGKYKVAIDASFGAFEWAMANPDLLFEIK